MLPSSKPLLVLWLGLIAIAILPVAGNGDSASAGDSLPPLQVTRSDAQGISFTLRTAEPIVDNKGHLQDAALNGRISDPGAPALPYYSALIALPPGANASVHLRESGITTRPVGALSAVPDAAQPGALDGFAGVASAGSLDEIIRPDPAIYGADALFPDHLYQISEPYYWRDLRVVRLSVFPLHYNPQQGMVRRAAQIEVAVSFDGALTAAGRVPPESGLTEAALTAVLNPTQAAEWRHLPADMNAGGTTFPIGIPTYKIAVGDAGIYEVTYADLQSAGMDVATVDPATFEMTYRGQPVAYQFVGNAADGFDPGEAVRFYAWPFDENRLDRDYISNNIYWLWAGGNPDLIATGTNFDGFAPLFEFPETTTKEPENTYFSTWTDEWDSFPNEPDAWYWTFLAKDVEPTVQFTFGIDLFDPAPSGPDVAYTFEWTSKPSPLVGGVPQPHVLETYWTPDNSYFVITQWFDKKNINIDGTVPQADLVDGRNEFDVVLSTNTTQGSGDSVYLNRITMNYQRQLMARDDQLIFKDLGGQREFNISNFNESDPASYIVWDISDRLQPVHIPIGASDIEGSGPYTIFVGSNSPLGQSAHYIAATAANVQPPVDVDQYVATDLDPAAGANWVAIGYGDFLPALDPLVAHRQDPLHGGFLTQVVDIADIVNQYGWGLPIPAAVRDYLAHGLANWPVPPEYVLMVGDATINPRGILCNFGCSGNPMNGDNQYMMTDLLFADRFQGQIPVDTTFTLLVGGENDYYPDVAIGRFPVQSSSELTTMVNKVLELENWQRAPEAWMERILFVSDDTDAGGNFCAENAATADLIPDSYEKLALCLPDGATRNDTLQLRADMQSEINAGVTLWNYRGHGGITAWGGAGGEPILTADMTSFFLEQYKPVLLSADCLDGFFAFPELPGLGETFLAVDNRGTSGHWSSSGLGFSSEHSILHSAFYRGLFDQGITVFGAAANYAKVQYLQSGAHLSELLAFTLLGDPALSLMRPDMKTTNVSTSQIVEPGAQVQFEVSVSNHGIYAPPTVITHSLPADLEFVDIQVSVPASVSFPGTDVIVRPQDNMAWNGSLDIVLTVQVADNASPGQTLSHIATAEGFGREIVAGDESAAVHLLVSPSNHTYAPVIQR